MFITFSDCHCVSLSSVGSQHFTLIRVDWSDSKGSAVTWHSAAERERDVDRSDPFSSKFIGWVIWTFNKEEYTEMHSGCSIHAVGSILIHLGLSISADGDLLGVRACTHFSMSITQWCAFIIGCGHWFNTLNGGPMVASVGICGIYLCMWLQKVNVIYRNNAECILGKIALRSAERSCKNLLCVSTDATAPNLFRTVTSSVLPPWQRMRSVKGRCNGT